MSVVTLGAFDPNLEITTEVITCHICGCDDNHACINEFNQPCYWVEIDYKKGIGLCSDCADKNNLKENHND